MRCQTAKLYRFFLREPRFRLRLCPFFRPQKTRANKSAAASLSLHAAQRADELMAAGDMEGRAVWHRIERAIDELQRTAPETGEEVH